MALAELLEQTLSWLADLSAVGGGESCEGEDLCDFYVCQHAPGESSRLVLAAR